MNKTAVSFPVELTFGKAGGVRQTETINITSKLCSAGVENSTEGVGRSWGILRWRFRYINERSTKIGLRDTEIMSKFSTLF